MRKILSVIISIGAILACWWGGYLGILPEEMRSPIATPTPMLASQIFKDPASLVWANDNPKTATKFAWRTFLALYAPECSTAPVSDRQSDIVYLYFLAVLVTIYEERDAKPDFAFLGNLNLLHGCNALGFACQ